MTAESLLARARKLMTLLATPSYRHALRRGVAASTEHQQAPIRADIRTAIDVGANRGQFALLVRERWPQARLICFEPLPRPRRVLARLLRDDPQAEIVDAAVGSVSGPATIHVSRADDSSSLLPITDRQSKTFPGTEELEAVAVRTITLDEHFAGGVTAPALLKIDVQGFELEVLRGAERVLDETEVVLVECSFVEFYGGQALADDVIRFLHRRSFSLTGASAPSLDANGTVLQVDLIFSKPRTT